MEELRTAERVMLLLRASIHDELQLLLVMEGRGERGRRRGGTRPRNGARRQTKESAAAKGSSLARMAVEGYMKGTEE